MKRSRLMELELGLALPNQSNSPLTVKGLDLNSTNNGVEMMMKKKNKGFEYQNMGFVEGFDDDDDEVESKDLSLLLWSGQQPNDEQDDGHKWRNLHINHENMDEEDEEIVGWPPLNSLRKELLHRNQGGWMAVHHHNHRPERVIPARNSMYVKVKMEGVPIGRKIDLRLYNSYQALTDAFIDMFAKYTRNENRDGEYRILYQDKEGDWMLAGDVPWETFVETVQRVEIILRND